MVGSIFDGRKYLKLCEPVFLMAGKISFHFRNVIIFVFKMMVEYRCALEDLRNQLGNIHNTENYIWLC